MPDAKAETTESDPAGTALSNHQTVKSDVDASTVVEPSPKDATGASIEEKTPTNSSGGKKFQTKSLSEVKAQAKILRLSRNIEVHQDKSKNVKFRSEERRVGKE